MKHFILVLLFMSMILVNTYCEAQVLPESTQIIKPDGSILTLDANAFLLTREDMEAATLALETVKIREDEIAALRRESILNYILVGLAAAAVGATVVLVVK